MKARKIMPAIFIFSLSIVLSMWAGEEKLQKKGSEESGRKSLIRKELLLREKRKLGPPRRNIFSLRRSVSREIGTNPAKLHQNSQENPTLPGEGASPLPLNIRYIGYIVSHENIVALIVFEGNALAVERGEVISEGVKVGEITPEEIEITGSDSQKRRYSLEGEQE